MRPLPIQRAPFALRIGAMRSSVRQSEVESGANTKRGTSRVSGAWQLVADQLQNDIISGRIHPRQHLVEDELMDRFDTSRHTARRALDELERLGLAVREPNRGVFVRSYTAREVEDLYELREMLEMRAAERIPTPAPPALVASLTTIQEAHEAASKAGQLAKTLSLNNKFHETLYHACGNPMLIEAVHLYSLRTQPIRMQYSTDARWRQQAVADHWHIIEILRSGDTAKLPALVWEHLQGPKRHYLQLYHATPV